MRVKVKPAKIRLPVRGTFRAVFRKQVQKVRRPVDQRPLLLNDQRAHFYEFVLLFKKVPRQKRALFNL